MVARTSGKLDNRRKVCPICGRPGSGPYARWVMNVRKKRFEPYYYFAHKHRGCIKWCYIPKKLVGEILKLSNHKSCETCANYTLDGDRPYCTYLEGYLTTDFSQDCEGYTRCKEGV